MFKYAGLKLNFYSSKMNKCNSLYTSLRSLMNNNTCTINRIVSNNFTEQIMYKKNIILKAPNKNAQNNNLSEISIFTKNQSNNFTNDGGSIASQGILVKKLNITHNNVNYSQEEIKTLHDENHIKLKIFGQNDRDDNSIPKPILNFKDLKIRPELKDSLMVDFPKPTPIQSITWPIALSGENLVGVAETGSGKTLSFVMPALVHVEQQNPKMRRDEGPIVLMLFPTRELAMQTHNVLNYYQKTVRFRSACVYGGTPKFAQARTLRDGVEIITATPGRLLDMIEMGKTNLNRVSYVVIDEADRLLDMGFEDDLRKILGLVQPDSQMLMWSATWPIEIRDLAEEFLKKYIHVKIGQSTGGLSVNPRIKQNFIFLDNARHKSSELEKLLNAIKDQPDDTQEELKSENRGTGSRGFPKTIIFSNYKRECDSLTYSLKNKYAIECIHGDRSQNDRDRVIRKFRSGDIDILVATDVAARGLDINDVKTIINYDFPNNIEDYVHRIGRTGRSGKSGVSYGFMTPNDQGIHSKLTKVLNIAKQPIPEELKYRPRSSSSNRRRY